ncbi:4-(cytidine 5'-diphospho)-2-C-methyl-D-erythritol kinase [Microbacterium halotolerans]|uniref:4-(cytidine 5'-diphospho)-2-C-methyl-D-erythritol kinase n=1 Tax=Microbacterium halotolerans TaxID=246613 RepID=UPI000E6A972C|nr:4-(cytidine 5'-diphospho)-2-C-methyl-D-erythritol kinase [Microbacterium halotolerans]
MTLADPFPSVRVRAPGKINVFLEVGRLQPDGYHDLATAFQAVSLYEDVVVTHDDDFTIAQVTGAVPVLGVPRDERNLALRAARLLAEETGYHGGVRIDLYKEVPVSGGMGGGSADAAATLLACDALWGTGLSSGDLQKLAARLGADVPFALLGGTAVGTGRGDRLSPALARGRVDWVLATNPVGVSTPEAYGMLDRHREEHGARIGRGAESPAVDTDVLHALRQGDPQMLAACLRNDLQAATLRLRPDLTETMELGESSGALAGIVSGSGPTIAFLAAGAEAAAELQQTLEAAGHDTLLVHGPVPGARIVG